MRRRQRAARRRGPLVWRRAVFVSTLAHGALTGRCTVTAPIWQQLPVFQTPPALTRTHTRLATTRGAKPTSRAALRPAPPPPAAAAAAACRRRLPPPAAMTSGRASQAQDLFDNANSKLRYEAYSRLQAAAVAFGEVGGRLLQGRVVMCEWAVRCLPAAAGSRPSPATQLPRAALLHPSRR